MHARALGIVPPLPGGGAYPFRASQGVDACPATLAHLPPGQTFRLGPFELTSADVQALARDARVSVIDLTEKERKDWLPLDPQDWFLWVNDPDHTSFGRSAEGSRIPWGRGPHPGAERGFR